MNDSLVKHSRHTESVAGAWKAMMAEICERPGGGGDPKTKSRLSPFYQIMGGGVWGLNSSRSVGIFFPPDHERTDEGC